MAKKDEAKVEEKNLPAVNMDDLFAGMSQEEIAELLGSTGQSSNLFGDKIPRLIVNKFGKVDAKGNKVDVGNFVLGQDIEIKDGKKICNNVGKDFGPNPVITILAYRQQYSFWDDNPKLRCNSQLFLFGQEDPIGSNYGHKCTGGDCPKRAEGLAKEDRCSCHYVVYELVGEEKEKALQYFQGDSYTPFQDYLTKLGKYPCCFFPTTLQTEEKSYGTNDYYVVTPVPDLANPFIQEERLANAKLAKEISEGIEQFKAQRKQKTKNALPPGMSMAKDNEGKNAKQLTGGDSAADLDDIEF